ncbi:MAG: hypothetical protein A2074_03565 [Candidatus Aquicultor primus]|uniref:Endolytic murein transglycosylase n=1 Tax=Candidatus Aquicultor primus TaxID=1797195 RepID=A0A1F2UHC1_9ACTN|nr:MAG: hypothetical protein A2074_03565 [Candidatus Aquicultor primus]
MIIATISLIVVIAVVAFAATFSLSAGSKTEKVEQKAVTVEIQEGMTATAIADLLEDKKVVKNALVFRLLVRQRGVDSEFKPGKYEFKTGMDNEVVIGQLVKGPSIRYIKLTIPEGWTATQIAERVGARTRLIKEEYLSAVNERLILVEYEFLRTSGAPTTSLEGYLYPDTFSIQEDITAQELINMQLGRFEEKTAHLNWDNAPAFGRTQYEILVIASMIERETRVDDERALVASVIYNRIAQGMPLQIDATIQYALPVWKDRLTLEDLKVDSPYNTYQNKGLPPGPICNPSAASIEAALNPTGDPYLYYVLAPDNSGRHVFTKTYDEFLNAKNQYKASQE